jgi:hypothetical protein
MAGEWIAWTKGLSCKPEVLTIARLTGLCRRLVAATMMEFWAWADSETEDGRLPGVALDQLPQVIPNTHPSFWQAVVEASWLQVDGRGLTIPNFSRWMGASAKKRLNKNARQARWRAPGKTTGRSKTVTEKPKTRTGLGEAGRPPDDVGASVDAQAPTREPNRTELGEVSPKTPPAKPRLFLEDHPPDPPSSPTPATDRARPRDDLFLAVAEVTASDPKVNGSNIGRVCKALRSADPPYTPEDVRRFAHLAPTRFPWHKGRPSLKFLKERIAEVRAGPAAAEDPERQAAANEWRAKYAAAAPSSCSASADVQGKGVAQ